MMSAMVEQAKACTSSHGPGSMDSIWKILLWSFACLTDGRWPLFDWNNEPLQGWRAEKSGCPLAGEYRFAFWGIAADLDYLCNVWRLRHFNAATNNCFRCNCNRSDTPWTDLTPSAAWRAKPVSMGQWMFTEKHPLFKARNIGYNVHHVMLDVMHLADLGMNQHILASILYILPFDCALPGRLDDKKQLIWQELLSAYQQLGTPAGEKLAHTTFEGIWEDRRSGSPSTYPVLGAKAAISRHFVPALKLVMLNLENWAPLHDRTAPFLTHSIALLVALDIFYETIMFEGPWLSEIGAQQAHDSLQAVGAHHQHLCNMSLEQGRKLFYLTEKAHYMQHVAIECIATRSNPRLGWTYADEDFMGRIAKVASQCTRARGPLRVTGALFLRYRHCLFLRWGRRARLV